VMAYYNHLGSSQKEFVIVGSDYGFSANYGHLDYSLATRAPQEIYPLISKWLSQTIP